MGNPVFDAFMRAQVQSQVNSTMQALYNNASYTALLDTIGPAIVFAHSQAGPYGFQMADGRPDLLKALVSLEPSGPPFFDWTGLPFAPSYFPESDSGSKLARPFGLTLLPLHYDPPIGLDASLLKHRNHSAAQADLAPCMLQVEPPRRLSNLGKVPMLFLTSESSYHAVYDYCTVKYLKQGGVEVDWIHLPNVGIRGNGHFVFMELNSQDIAEHIAPWIEKYSSM